MPKNVAPAKTLWQLAKTNGWPYPRVRRAADSGLLETLDFNGDTVVTPAAEERFKKVLSGELPPPNTKSAA